MKKVLVILVSFISLVTLSACGEKSSEKEETTSSSSLPALGGQLLTDKVEQKEKVETSSDLALEGYIERITPEIAKIQEQAADVYSEISLAKNDAHSMTATYVFKNQFTLSAEDLNTVRDNFKDLNNSLLDGMKTAKVVDPKLQIIFKLPDGSVVIDEPYTYSEPEPAAE